MVDSIIIDKYNNILPEEVHSILGKYILADGFDFVLDLHNSKGSYLIDAITGKKYLDFFTFFASNPLGMNHSEMDNEEFINKIGKIALNKPSCSDIYSIEMAEFVDIFFKIAVPSNFKYSFFIEGGALANENALKIAFDWKVRKNFLKGYTQEKGHKVISFEHAFHGRSGYTLSLTNTDPVKTRYFPKFNDWIRVSSPFIKFPINEFSLKDLIERENFTINQIVNSINEFPDEIACIIIEPIQAEGGDNHFRSEFLQKLKDISLENDILLIFDEVQTGLGITGNMWACQTFGVMPDIVTFGKKMQVCGLFATDRIDDIPDNVFHTSSRINSTWGGNLVDMVRATKYLQIISKYNLVKNSSIIGKVLLEELSKLQLEFPDIVSNVRGVVLMCSFDFPSIDKRNRFKSLCNSNGLIILGCGEKSIRFRTALNITLEDLLFGLKLIKKSIVELQS